MSVQGGPDIIRDGLIAFWDAGNVKSYNGVDNRWYDLSGNGHTAYGDPNAAGSGYDDVRFPIWQSNNGGRFYFNGTDGFTILTDMGSYTELTTEFWVYRDTNTSTLYLTDGRNDGGSYFLTNYDVRQHNFDIHAALMADSPVTYSTASDWWLKWIHVVITSSSGGSALWIDTEPITDSRLKASGSLNENLGQYYRIGGRFTSINRWQGYMSNIKFYNRVLSKNEILKNYNVFKHRFN